jgi:hypothetical protein
MRSRDAQLKLSRCRRGIVRFQRAKIDGAAWFGRDGLAFENPPLSNGSAWAESSDIALPVETTLPHPCREDKGDDKPRHGAAGMANAIDVNLSAHFCELTMASQKIMTVRRFAVQGVTAHDYGHDDECQEVQYGSEGNYFWDFILHEPDSLAHPSW